ncbi:hypothetical protein BN12_1230006 [Nostocoides japonicum T1-X7]|uniref:Uncharacterized protein n=1 Tax=Nostocoides japonicum T1-X7 TaxID=1194083 RepID=A0A077LSY7_9MICO|nr:hypothetical protein BN12_1230006 [Tetrasphaera japonica T1-X7]
MCSGRGGRRRWMSALGVRRSRGSGKGGAQAPIGCQNARGRSPGREVRAHAAAGREGSGGVVHRPRLGARTPGGGCQVARSGAHAAAGRKGAGAGGARAPIGCQDASGPTGWGGAQAPIGCQNASGSDRVGWCTGPDWVPGREPVRPGGDGG